jgi:hypothetical protein
VPGSGATIIANSNTIQQGRIAVLTKTDAITWEVGGVKPSSTEAFTWGVSGIANAISSGYEDNTNFFIGSPTGKAGLVSFTRSSDLGAVTGQTKTQGITSFVQHDSNNYAYGFYGEIRRQTGAGSATNMSLDVINYGSAVSTDPYSTTAVGSTGGVNLQSGRTDLTGLTNASYAIAVNYNGSMFDKGIVFASNSLSGTGDAINLASGHAIQQWTAVNNRGSKIVFSTTSSTTCLNLVFSDGVITFQNTSSSPLFTIGSTYNASLTPFKLPQYTNTQLATLTAAAYPYCMVFSTTSGKPLISNGTNWIDMTGTVVI